MAAGSKAGYEIIDDGLALSGPKYYQRFHDACLSCFDDYGVNQFKFDGTGNADTRLSGQPTSTATSPRRSSLIGDIRADKPDLFINLTTGTYPSPFWLRYADSIWRGGEDHELPALGTKREQWITYRDAETYQTSC